VILDLNRSLQGFDKPGVVDVSFRFPNRICKNSITFDRLNILNIHEILVNLSYGKVSAIQHLPISLIKPDKKIKVSLSIADIIYWNNKICLLKGKPSERLGRKASGLRSF